MNISDIQKDWLKKEQLKLTPKNNKKGKRRYIHFDYRINLISEKITKNVWSPFFISRHAFKPFIRVYKIKNKRVKVKQPSVTGPLRHKLDKQSRPIDYATHRDAIIYSWYAYLINKKYDETIKKLGLHENVIAYRSVEGGNNIDFAKEAINFINQNPKFVAVALDIEKFFERIAHNELKEKLCDLIESGPKLPDDYFNILKSITNYRYVEFKSLFKKFGNGLSLKDFRKNKVVCDEKDFRDKVVKGRLLLPNKNLKYGRGIPQGSPISCVLSNLYLLDFDLFIKKEVSALNGLYMRYSDDILIIIPESDISRIVDMATKFISEKSKLEINKDKTETIKFKIVDGKMFSVNVKDEKAKPLTYLGVEYDGQNTRLRHKGMAKFQRKRASNIKTETKKLISKGIVPQKTYTESVNGKSGPSYLSYAKGASEKLDSAGIKKQINLRKVVKQDKKLVDKYEKKYSHLKPKKDK